MKDIEKRLQKLEQRYGGSGGPGGPRSAVLGMRWGEDGALIAAEWHSKHPSEQPANFILQEIVGEMPRLEVASRESVSRSLPLAKRWLAYKYDGDSDGERKRMAEEAEWRRISELAGIDYDSVLPESGLYRESAYD